MGQMKELAVDEGLVPFTDAKPALLPIDPNSLLGAMMTALVVRYCKDGQWTPADMADFAQRAWAMHLIPLGEKPEVVPLRGGRGESETEGDQGPDSNLTAFPSLDRLRVDALMWCSAAGLQWRRRDDLERIVTDDAVLKDQNSNPANGDVTVEVVLEFNRSQRDWIQLANDLKDSLKGSELVAAIGPMPREWDRVSGIRTCWGGEVVDARMRTARRTAADRAERQALNRLCPGLDSWRRMNRPSYEQEIARVLGVSDHQQPTGTALRTGSTDLRSEQAFG